MRITTSLCATLGLVFLGAPLASGLSAQEAAAHTHIQHVADAFAGAPQGLGLLPTAIAEAEVVIQHAELAAAEPGNLAAIQRHATHVLHAVDPALAEGGGPGLGYGLRPAAEGVARHIQLAADSEGASDDVELHARHIRTSAQNVVERADAIADLAARIRAAATADEASELLEELTEIAEAVIDGVDANRDGGVGWRKTEGGLEQARQHVNVLKDAEELSD
jgi:hypothetical protein